MWPFKKKAKPIPAIEINPRGGVFTTDLDGMGELLKPKKKKADILSTSIRVQPVSSDGAAMDSASLGGLVASGGDIGVPDAQLMWYASQGFIGFNVCSVLAQHWLVDKACGMVGRDAVRHGYDIDVDVDGENGDSEKIIKLMRRADKRHKINQSMAEFIKMGRVFGIRIAIFKVESDDPQYYEKPFNIDGVTPNSYRGLSQVDPIWCVPELTTRNLTDPSSQNFYEPTFWTIQGRRYHHSHLAIYIPFPVTDILKPTYQYAGASVPQRIYERVYASERTANEAPQLAMTKRLTVLKVNSLDFFANMAQSAQNLLEWCLMRDNYGVKVVDKETEDVAQHETALGGFDEVLMTQYQLVASIAEVPATKLLGTSPKGFNATGDYEAQSYRETLESVQTNDLTELLERHHAIVMRSDVAPKLGISPVNTDVVWHPLDSPTAEEWANINKIKAETDRIYWEIGSVDDLDIFKKIRADKNSDYFGLEERIDDTDDNDDDLYLTGEENGEAQN